jgi:hypothetical protein
MGLPRAWGCYAAWNQAIRAHLFAGQFDDHPVYLDVDDDFFDQAFADASKTCPHGLSSPRSSLIHCLNGTLEPPGASSGVFQRHRAAARRWREDYFERGDRADPPSCLALLLVLVLVAEEMARAGEIAANDYFGRLAHTLNDALGTDYSKSEIQDSYYEHVDGPKGALQGGYSLWHLLNDWLEESDGELGLPTAYAVDGREYVSVPIGQSLLRSADRAHLYRLFAQDFEEYRSSTPEEMTDALTGGLRNPPFSTALTNLWNRVANRPAIVERALAELLAWDATWDEETGDGQTQSRSRALLRAVLRERPRPRLSLTLTVHVSEAVIGQYQICEGAPDLGERCMRAGYRSVDVEAGNFGSRWAHFEPADALDISEVLVRPLELERDSRRLIRRYRAVNVLQLDSDEQVYVETGRAGAAIPLIVLASDGHADKVTQLLGAIARPGWLQRAPSTLPGVPPGWTAFTGVELLGKLPDDVEVLDELAALIPPTRLDLDLVGGLRLPGRRSRREWHRDRPPEVIVTSPDVDAPIEATVVSVAEGRTETKLGRGVGVHAWTLSEQAVPDGLLEVVASSGDFQKAARLRFRNSDSTRSQAGALELGLLARSDGVIASVGKLEGELSLAYVGQGGIVRELERDPYATSGVKVPQLQGVPAGESAEDGGDVEEDPILLHTPADLPGCVIRPGAHYWILPGGTAVTVVGRCRLCGLIRRFNNAYVSPERAAKIRAAAASPGANERAERVKAAIERRVKEVEPQPAQSPDDWDLLLDALCSIGAGTWTTFIAVSSQTISSCSVHEVARALASLGHVEFDVGGGDRDVERWILATPAIVSRSDGQFFLSGRRSAHFVGELEKAVADAGGLLIAEEFGSQPRRISISGVSEEAVRDLAGRIRTALQNDLTFAGRAAERLLDRLPTLAWLRSTLSQTPFAAGFTETFSLDLGRWAPNHQLIREGDAVRTSEGRRLYGVVETIAAQGHAVLRRGGYQLVKHMSAQILGQGLLSYDAQERALWAPLGAELPWLYERAVCLSTGQRPRRYNGRVRYGDVPPAVADRTSALLYSKDGV